MIRGQPDIQARLLGKRRSSCPASGGNLGMLLRLTTSTLSKSSSGFASKASRLSCSRASPHGGRITIQLAAQFIKPSQVFSSVRIPGSVSLDEVLDGRTQSPALVLDQSLLRADSVLSGRCRS